MGRHLRVIVAVLVSGWLTAAGGGALADPGEDRGHADDIPVPAPTQPLSPPGSANMELLDVADKDGTVNSDVAFYGNWAFVGNYDGFRVIDIRNPRDLRVLSDTKCRANQGDLSVFRARRGRLILLQSIDRPVTAPDCSAADTATITEPESAGGLTVTRTRARFGWEGLRVFDVTDPTNPRFLAFYQTECGSHTHTLVPDPRNRMVHAYVASYPLGANITPQVDWGQADDLRCDAPHSAVSVVHLPLGEPEHGWVSKVGLSADTEYYDPDGLPRLGGDGQPTGTAPPFQACHDHQAFLPRDVMVASCAGDAQYWDIRNRGEPTSGDDEPHTHVQREDGTRTEGGTRTGGTTESFDFIHNATVTWDGKVVTLVDESGGGGAPRCDGDQSKRGFTFFYPLVRPGAPVDGWDDLLGRYMIPRPQSSQICVSHNGNVLPVAGRHLQAQAFYQGGNTLVDFTDPGNPWEVAWADLEDEVGQSDSWSSYWYNGVLYVNGGLNRRGSNRGFEAYRLRDVDGSVLTGPRWRHLNPQTQERGQGPRR